jgi:hypothetical protein
MTWLTSRPLPLDSARLADELRLLFHRGNWQESRPPWRQAAGRQLPDWSARIPATGAVAVREAQQRVTDRAAETSRAHFLWRNGGDLVCASDPVPDDVICSVNKDGEWSVHVDSATVPVETAPDTLLRQALPSAVQLAAQDVVDWRAATGRSASSEAPLAAQQAQARPARRGR